MPKGFLVKRQRHSGSYSSWRCKKVGVASDEERHSDSGSDQENVFTAFGSPDSGYSASPVSVTFKDIATFKDSLGFKDGPFKDTVVDLSKDSKDLPPPPPLTQERTVLGSLSTTPSSSPLSVGTSGYPSPFHYFDRLTVSSPSRPSPGGSSVTSSVSRSSPLGSPAVMPPPANPISIPVNPSSPKKRNADSEVKQKTPKKPKAARKIAFDEDKTSPVSGTIIKDLSDDEEDGAHFVCGDIEPSMNYVEITPEAKAELARIDNKIGDYICQLCKEFYHDAFQLAQHKCSRIVHVEYRCPECDKVFNCPANLASHRRWHKPRPSKVTAPTGNKVLGLNPTSPSKSDSGDDERRTPSPEEGQFECSTCGKKFKRQAYLRKHQASNGDERPYPCRLCSKVFRSESARSKHMLQHGTDLQLPALPLGHLAPPQTAPLALTNHMGRMEQQDHHLETRDHRDLACPVCSLTFGDKVSLERHQRVHSEIYACKYCPSTFYSSPGLTKHINKCHPSESRQIVMLHIPVN